MMPLAILLGFVVYLLLWTAFKGKEQAYNPFRVLSETWSK